MAEETTKISAPTGGHQGERVMEHWPVRELKNQYDPDEMISAIIRVITEDKHSFRTVLPASVAERVREEQAEA